MASPLSVGIELQPAGIDRRWVRLWLLDRSAIAAARCRLVERSAALRRAQELQAATGAGEVWWVCAPSKSPPGNPGLGPWGSGPGLCGSCGGATDHRSGSGPFVHSSWNPFQRL